MNEKRTERYHLLRSLGYSSKAASRISGLSSERIQNTINQQRDELESIPRNERTVEQRKQLQAYRGVKRQFDPRILTKNQKRELWGEWSQKGNSFPEERRKGIREKNAAAGRDPFDRFGYQAEYFEYVEEYDDVEDGDFYEQGIRSANG